MPIMGRHKEDPEQRRARLERACILCGSSFVAVRPSSKQQFCSMACGGRYIGALQTAKKLELTCQQCGITYKPKQRRRKTFCSRDCSYANRAERKQDLAQKEQLLHEQTHRPRACLICNATFLPKTVRTLLCGQRQCRIEHCRRVSIKSSQRRDVRNRAARSCRECGISFVPEYGNQKRTYCSERCADRHIHRVSKATRRARMRSNVCQSIDPFQIFERDGWKCHLCGVGTPQRLRGTHADRAPELDHILPLAAGGDHTFDNVACACRKCNQAKGALPLGQIRLTFAASAVAVMQAV